MIRQIILIMIVCFSVECYKEYYYDKSNIMYDRILKTREIQDLLDAHNYWRAKAAKGKLNNHRQAMQMPQMYWDTELAASAKNYSRLCQWIHSEELQKESLEYKYSENLYVSSYIQNNMYRIIEDLALEHKDYNHNTLECAGNVCDHYKTIVWENSIRVGCGITWCKRVGRDSFDIKHHYFEWLDNSPNGAHLLVCQYYPKGDYSGLAPYTYGKTGAMCKKGQYSNSTGFQEFKHRTKSKTFDLNRSKRKNSKDSSKIIRIGNGSIETMKSSEYIAESKIEKSNYQPYDFEEILNKALCNNINDICLSSNRCNKNKFCYSPDGISYQCLDEEKIGYDPYKPYIPAVERTVSMSRSLNLAELVAHKDDKGVESQEPKPTKILTITKFKNKSKHTKPLLKKKHSKKKTPKFTKRAHVGKNFVQILTYTKNRTKRLRAHVIGPSGKMYIKKVTLAKKKTIKNSNFKKEMINLWEKENLTIYQTVFKLPKPGIYKVNFYDLKKPLQNRPIIVRPRPKKEEKTFKK